MQGQEVVEVDQLRLVFSVLLEGNEYISSLVRLERNEQAASTLSYTDASTHWLPVPGATPQQWNCQFSIVRRGGADGDQRWRIEGAAFVRETCHCSTSAKRLRDRSLHVQRWRVARTPARGGLPCVGIEPGATPVLPD